jgi:hypothetical protein
VVIRVVDVGNDINNVCTTVVAIFDASAFA